MGNQFIGSTEAEQEEMLGVLGNALMGEFGTLDDLFDTAVPKDHRHSGSLSTLGKARSELEVTRMLHELALKNTSFESASSFAGAGYYQRVIPAAVRDIVWTGEWMTPYTPYQPEVSQGILAALFDFQSLMATLSGMKVVNAGLYHGANALVEGALMACRLTGRDKVIVSDAVNPVAIRNLETYFKPRGLQLVRVQTKNGVTEQGSIEELVDEGTAAVIVQNPNFWGLLDGMDGQAGAAHSKKALYIVYGGGDQVSLGRLLPPADYGADIYAAEGQHFGEPIGFGGPHVGVLGIVDEKNVRQLPGRLVLQAQDINGKRAWRLGLQTREQHIRREKATSNTCTAESLMAVMSTVYLAVVGKRGFAEASSQSYHVAHYLAGEISQIPGFELMHPGQLFFNEFAVRTPQPAHEIVDKLAERGILAGVPAARAFPYSSIDGNVLLIAATEANNSKAHLDEFIGGLREHGRQ